jgi:cell division protein ZapA
VTKLFKAEILGQEFTLRGDLESDLVDRVAQLVNQKIQEVQASMPTHNKIHLSIMAALNIAHDYLELKQNLDQLEKTIEEKGKRWLLKLNALGFKE